MGKKKKVTLVPQRQEAFHSGVCTPSVRQQCIFIASEFPGTFHLSDSAFFHHLYLGSALRSADFPSPSDATCPTPTQSLFFNLRMLKYLAILKHSQS